ncbi:MAG: ribosome-associated translation inhibitor RaiA [Candidatus Pacebacteria bacterium]|nr:ribosome-associated translation inhibitor RaiA [Candidatus Paceibacterota bacterium]
MNIDIHAKNIELNAPLRTFIEDKIGDLEHILSTLGEYTVRVEVAIPSQHHASGAIYYTEANITVGSHLFRAESNHFDLHSSIVDVKEDLKNQITKFKDKQREQERQPLEE